MVVGHNDSQCRTMAKLLNNDRKKEECPRQLSDLEQTINNHYDSMAVGSLSAGVVVSGSPLLQL